MITKSKLLISILAFMLVVNLLVIFNLDYLYIRAILAFIFIITIPGLLIMLCFKIRNITPWEYLVYTIGLSVAFIMFAGLAINWTLPWLHITDKPLSLYPILISFDIFLLILMTIVSIRNKDLLFEPKFPNFTWLDRIFIIISLFFPVLSILGAFILNNNGPNYLTMIMLGGIAVYVFCIVLFRDKLNDNVYPWAILMISISILLSSSLRSWYVSGVDTNLEYQIFQITKEKSFWIFSSFKNTYNAMLSVTILPTILSLFAKINDSLILKLFFPVIFMFVPVIVYLISKKYFKSIICFLASFFFMSQSAFINWSWIPIRQEISFLFFGLMLLVIFSKEINPVLKKVLFLIFGFSMIVSHYSTTYIALAIFVFTYIITFFYKIYENQKIKKGKIKPEEKQKFHLTLLLLLLLLIFAFIWYAQITSTIDGLIGFTKKSFSNIESMFNKNVQAQGVTPFNQFNIFFKPIDKNLLLQGYLNEKEIRYNHDYYSNEDYSDYNPQIIDSKVSPPRIDYNLQNKIYLFGEIIKKLMKIFIILGFFSIMWMSHKKGNIDYNYLFMIIACFLLFGLLIFLPFISIQYDLLRIYQQVLILLSIQVVLGGLLNFKFLKEDYSILVITLLLLFFFLFPSGFISQTMGGIDSPMRLNNLGSEYDIYFVHTSELTSADWLFINPNPSINSDRYAISKLYLSNNKNYSNGLIESILPHSINKNSYVYSDYSNTIQGLAFKSYDGSLLSFNFPTEFLNDNKNKVYNNGGSDIFK